VSAGGASRAAGRQTPTARGVVARCDLASTSDRVDSRDRDPPVDVFRWLALRRSR